MGNTFNSGGGEQSIGIGKGAIGKQVNTSATSPQAPAEDLCKLLKEIKARLPELPDKAQAKLRNAVEGAELEAQEDKPDREEIAAKLTDTGGHSRHRGGSPAGGRADRQRADLVREDGGDVIPQGQAPVPAQRCPMRRTGRSQGIAPTTEGDMDNQFDSKGGEQNIGIGDYAIGKQENATQEVRGNGSIFSGTGNVTVNGIPPALFAEYAGKLAVTETALASFFRILKVQERQIPRSDLDSKLREIASHYKLLLARVDSVQSTDPQAAKLKAEVNQAIDAGDYAKAEELLEDIARQYSLSLAAAETHAELAKLQEVQLCYAKAAAHWQKAADLVPDENKENRAYYLNEAGYDLWRIAKYKEALPLWEQRLAISLEIGNRQIEGETLNSISLIYKARGDYATALQYREKSLTIHREIGNRKGEGMALNNISLIYMVRGDYATALQYIEQSLAIHQEIGNRKGEGIALGNIGNIYRLQGNYDQALSLSQQSLSISREIGDKMQEAKMLHLLSLIYCNCAQRDYSKILSMLEQSLRISQKIGDRHGEAETSYVIGCFYLDQNNLARSKQYISRAVQLAEEIGHPELEKWRTFEALSNGTICSVIVHGRVFFKHLTDFFA